MTTNVHLEPEKALAREEGLKRKLVNLALKKKIAVREDELAIRDILPATDLGYANEKWETAPLKQYVYNTVVTKRLSERKVIGFAGVKDLKGAVGTGITSVIRFTVGPAKAKTLAIWNIEQIETEKEAEAYSDEDIVFENGKYIGIDFYSLDTGISSCVKLIGFVVEPKGEVVGQGGA